MRKKYEIFISQVGGVKGSVTVSVDGIVVGSTFVDTKPQAMEALQAFAEFVEESLNKNPEKRDGHHGQ